jgi:hypothetical protein
MQNLQRESKTPYGNQRKITRLWCPWPTRWPSVLNALRQSEENHGVHVRRPGSVLMCSTPYGNQRKIIPVEPNHPTIRAIVLNALRQSEENHWCPGGDGHLHPLVLNALRQSEENHAYMLIYLSIVMMVLNALRQSEENHLGYGRLSHGDARSERAGLGESNSPHF